LVVGCFPTWEEEGFFGADGLASTTLGEDPGDQVRVVARSDDELERLALILLESVLGDF
jgi:hypothetical protein